MNIFQNNDICKISFLINNRHQKYFVNNKKNYMLFTISNFIYQVIFSMQFVQFKNHCSKFKVNFHCSYFFVLTAKILTSFLEYYKQQDFQIFKILLFIDLTFWINVYRGCFSNTSVNFLSKYIDDFLKVNLHYFKLFHIYFI